MLSNNKKEEAVMFTTHHEIFDMESARRRDLRQDMKGYRRITGESKLPGGLRSRADSTADSTPNLLAKLSFGLIQLGSYSQKE